MEKQVTKFSIVCYYDDIDAAIDSLIPEGNCLVSWKLRTDSEDPNLLSRKERILEVTSKPWNDSDGFRPCLGDIFDKSVFCC